MENNKKNLIINNTDEQFAENVEMQTYAGDGNVTAERLCLSGGENKSCIVGSVDINNLAFANDVPPNSIKDCELKICGAVSGEVSDYTVYGINGAAVATCGIVKDENGNAEISIPVRQLANETGNAEFGVELSGNGTINVNSSRVAMSVSSGYGSDGIDIARFYKIEVTKLPDKTIYTAGEYFDKTGMVVTLYAKDGSEAPEITNYKIDKTGPLKASDKYINISYEMFTTQIPIYVEDESVYADNSKASSEFGENLKLNLASGRLLYVNGDLSVGANSYKISVSHVYNSKLYNSLSNYFGGMPRGWKLDAHQCLISLGENKYQYIDGAGYIHNFTVGKFAHGLDEEGQGLTLMVGSGKFITDMQGNRLEFDSNGRLIRSISGKNSAIRKVYTYTNNLLTKIYDSRKAAIYIELSYNKDGLLSGIHAVENGIYKKSIIFDYTADNLLSGKTVMSGAYKFRELTYGYNSSKLLETVLKNDNTQAVISYDEFRRVTVISSGCLSGKDYTEKSKNSFEYALTQYTGEKRVISNTVKNKDGLRLKYYFNNKGEAVSAFELTDKGLITGEKEQGDLLYNTSGTNGVNCSVSNRVNDASVLYREELDLSELGAEHFAVTLWAKHDCECSGVRVTLTYEENINKKTYETKTACEDIDGGAAGAWQYVSIPFSLAGNKKIKNIQISARNESGSIVFNVTDCRITPAAKSGILINNDNIDLKDIKRIKLTAKTDCEIVLNENCRAENYLTYSDLYKTLLNMAHNSKNGEYDFIYSNGTKTVDGITGVRLVDRWGDEYTLSLDSSGKANMVAVNYTADNRTVTYNYITFGADAIISNVKYKDAGNNFISETEQRVTYTGNVLSETDEYGVKKEYAYNDCGDLLTETLIGTDGKRIITQKNVYDGIDEYTVQSSSGYGSENYAYVKPFEKLDKLTINDYDFNGNSYSPTIYNLKYTYDVYGENLTAVTANGSSGKMVENRITYIEDRLASVSDESSKYYFDCNNKNDTYIFGVYEYYDRILLQKAEQVGKRKTNYIYRRKGANTDTFESEYDNYGRLLEESYNGTPKVFYSYNDVNGVSKTASVLSMVCDDYTGNYHYCYFDEDGNVTSCEDNNVRISEGGTKISFGGGETYDLEQVYDSAKVSSRRLTHTKVKTGGKEINSYCWNYGYTGLGLLNYKSSSEGSYNYVYKEYDDRVLPVIDKCEYGNRGSLYIDWNYGYDSNGNIVSVKRTVNSGAEETTTYEYDKLGRIKKENDKTYAYNFKGRLIRSGNNACGYDIRGRLTDFGNIKLTYDNYGNRIGKGDTQYVYTRGNLLESIQDVASYTYDYSGTRYTKTVNGVTTTYIYNGGKLLGENRSDGTKLRYFYDAQGICGFRYNNRDIIYVKNIFGDVEYLQDYNTDKVLAEYSYDAWGNCTVLSDTDGIGALNPIRYRSYYYDTESKLYYLMTRYYDPETATFLTLDSVEYLNPEEIGGIDLYAYCYNNPIMYYDPKGHFAVTLTIIGLIVGAIIGATIGGIVAYNIAGSNGATGWELSGWTILGILTGGVVGGALGAALGAIGGAIFPEANAALAGGFSISVPTLMNLGGALGIGMTEVAVSGSVVSTVAVGGAVATGLLGSGYVLSNYMEGDPNSTVSKNGSTYQYDELGHLISRHDTTHTHFIKELQKAFNPHTHIFEWWSHNGVWRWKEIFVLPF